MDSSRGGGNSSSTNNGGNSAGGAGGDVRRNYSSSSLPPFINRIIQEAGGDVAVVSESDLPRLIIPPSSEVRDRSQAHQQQQPPQGLLGGLVGGGGGLGSRESLSDMKCWICFAGHEDDETAEWVKPCRCRGTTKWVHQACIQRWIDEKQKGNPAAKVLCPQCNTEYFIFYPPQGSLVVIMDSVDTLISRVCPYVAAGLVCGAIYWTAVTYGAITVMQIAGHKEGLSIMERADPLFLLFGLPCIPVMLILGKMIRWEDSVLHFIRKHSWKIPIFRHILPSSPPPMSQQLQLPPLSDPISATRILCGALLLPTVASLFGNVLFDNVKSNFRRAILGGMAFITIKGILRIYHKQQQHVRQSKRKIMDFSEERERERANEQNQGTGRGRSNSPPRPRY